MSRKFLKPLGMANLHTFTRPASQPHPLPAGLLLLVALIGEGRERRHLVRLDGAADDVAQPGLVLHRAAHGRHDDEVHVSLVLGVQLQQVLALLRRALVLLLKVQNVLQRDLNHAAAAAGEMVGNKHNTTQLFTSMSIIVGVLIECPHHYHTKTTYW